MLTGDWDLDEIASVNEEVAYTFFIVFTLVANFMLLNMFLAVIMEAYESLGEAKEVVGCDEWNGTICCRHQEEEEE